MLAGFAQLGLDWLTFVGLTSLGIGVGSANVAGRVGGAVLGFWLNARYTFAVARLPLSQRARQGIRFIAGWVLTAALSTAAVWGIEQQLGLQAAWIGKLLVDGVIAVLGFALSRYWIFR